MGLTTPATVQKLQEALHAKAKCVWAPSGTDARGRKREILLREPDAGKLHVRFDEREVETEQGRAREALAHERAGRIGPPKPPRHFSTLLSVLAGALLASQMPCQGVIQYGAADMKPQRSNLRVNRR